MRGSTRPTICAVSKQNSLLYKNIDKLFPNYIVELLNKEKKIIY